MQVDGALGDAGPPGDVVETRCGKATRNELVQRGFDDGLAPLRRAGSTRFVGACAGLLAEPTFGKVGFAGSAATIFAARRRAAGFDGVPSPDLVVGFVMIPI